MSTSNPYPDPYPDVQGICPSCGGDSLFLGAGGYVTCRRLACPEPTAVTDMLRTRIQPDRLRPYHIVTLGPDTWHIAHPLDCNLDTCEHDATAQGWPQQPRALGKYAWVRPEDPPSEWDPADE